MKAFLTLILFSAGSHLAVSQDKVFTDRRDGQQYRYTEINGLKWMLDDLNYFTELSFDLAPEINDTLKYRVPEARWYHLLEIDTVCPAGWRLPTADEWFGYIVSRVEGVNGKYSVSSLKDTYTIRKFNDDIDLYEDGNSLELQYMGIFQGSTFQQHPGMADYWIQDLPMKSEIEKGSGRIAVRESYENRAHVHLFPEYTNFHSHMHNLDENKPDEMRRFLVRCVCEETEGD